MSESPAPAPALEPIPRLLLSCEEAGQSLGLSETKVRELVAEKVIRARRLGPKLVRIHVDDLRAYAAGLEDRG